MILHELTQRFLNYLSFFRDDASLSDISFSLSNVTHIGLFGEVNKITFTPDGWNFSYSYEGDFYESFVLYRDLNETQLDIIIPTYSSSLSLELDIDIGSHNPSEVHLSVLNISFILSNNIPVGVNRFQDIFDHWNAIRRRSFSVFGTESPKVKVSLSDNYIANSKEVTFDKGDKIILYAAGLGTVTNDSVSVVDSHNNSPPVSARIGVETEPFVDNYGDREESTVPTPPGRGSSTRTRISRTPFEDDETNGDSSDEFPVFAIVVILIAVVIIVLVLVVIFVVKCQTSTTPRAEKSDETSPPIAGLQYEPNSDSGGLDNL